MRIRLTRSQHVRFVLKRIVHEVRRPVTFVPQKKDLSFLLPLILSGLLLLSSTKSYEQPLANIQNPVLPGVADAGVIKFNGEYYIGGVFTRGSLYTSRNLVKWQGPVHVLSMNNDWATKFGVGDEQIHANDIRYINGVFHMFWSVNYWGKERNIIHIAHATSPDILGPFKEPVKDSWVDNRIDPQLFVDDDGKMYLYMVKFTDGNTIWTRPMKDAWTFSGEPIYLFASLANTWETLDNRVEEGPWVFKYRNRYYLMYNANHTSPEWGNYALGIAEASSPTTFNHGSKYPYPVVSSNQVELEDTYVDLLKYSKEGTGFLYTYDQPFGSWNMVNFDAANWIKGKSGFGSDIIRNSTTRMTKTPWKTPEIWVRKAFTIDRRNTGNLMLRINHDGDTEVFLNGQEIYVNKGKRFTSWNLDEKASGFLKNGENVLAIHSRQGSRSNFLDASLFDLKDNLGDDILFSPGQPNILRGPNGFEWWLIYMANKNSDRRGQYINRVHFFDKRLVVDGITSANTAGYHPNPSQPTFSDLFNGTDVEWKNHWEQKNGTWTVTGKELVQSGKNSAEALIKSIPATHYLFEAGVKMNESVPARAGILAWWKDNDNWLKIVLDQKSKEWSYLLREGSVVKSSSFALPPDFNYRVYHKIGVYKNASDFTIRLDDLPAPGNSLIHTKVRGKGIPGICSEGSNASFDGILYTIGWDEFDSTITGWEPSDPNRKSSWSVSDKGLSQSDTSGEKSVFKGDLLNGYEISLQVQSEKNQGSAGIYPVYTDANNYLKAVFDFKKQKFIVSGKEKGRTITTSELSLSANQCYYADMRYTDFLEKHFTFNTPAYINEIRFSKTLSGNPDTLIEGRYKKLDIFYKNAGKWSPLREFKEVSSPHPAFERIVFDPLKADELKFVNKDTEERNLYPYKVWLNDVFRQSYNLRVVKLAEEIIFFVDDKEVMRMKNTFSSSRLGLLTQATAARFNGITMFHLPDADR